MSTTSEATGAPAARSTACASVTASAWRIRMQPCDAARPMLAESGVPWMKYGPRSRIFTRPIGLRGPGGVTVSLRAHGLFGGIHQGFQITPATTKRPVGVRYFGMPTATR